MGCRPPRFPPRAPGFMMYVVANINASLSLIWWVRGTVSRHGSLPFYPGFSPGAPGFMGHVVATINASLSFIWLVRGTVSRHGSLPF